ncbi:hypothetical protein CYMTET_55729 [Cymbomonas tetramitiformis]|uniref:Phosphatidylinositol-glycan-specific phospholipase D n=1 Tax=Cymbomonas tetramitiformis TaxID=36881 RepID=A0AAE0BDI1_9CHLO|nr:hypothetical protein CYMTET_55729 [Cymbomonas tetramitiformis]
MTTHTLIAERARVKFYTYTDGNTTQYKRLLDKHEDALQGGAPFPDYLYTCGTDHDAGEVAHWPPFHAAAAKYIRDKYPRPWDEDTEKLVVWMHGLISHFIADNSWHGMHGVPSGYGFIQTLGEQNFNCSGNLCQVAHNEADTGGEFVARRQANLNFFKPFKWYIPIDDAIEIFAMMGKNVSKSSLEKCSELFFAGSAAVKYLSELVYRLETKTAPEMVDEYIGLMLGGIDDNAVWTSFMWKRWNSWLDFGPPPHATLLQQGTNNYLQGHGRLSPKLEALVRLLGGALQGTQHVKSKNVGRGLKLTFEVAGLSEERFVLLLQKRLDMAPPEPASASREAMEDSWTAGMPSAEEELKRMLQHLKETGGEAGRRKQPAASLALGGADIRSAAVIRGTNQTTAQPADTHAAEAISTYSAPDGEALAYFGSALASGDVNCDGIEDLIFGAYGHSPIGLPQAGAVYVKYGRATGVGKGSQSKMDLSLNGTEIYGRFGAAIAVLDFNLDGCSDLVVGSPTAGWDASNLPTRCDAVEHYDCDPHPGYTQGYKGGVSVFFGGASGLSTGRPDVRISATEFMAFFGEKLFGADVDGDGASDLLIGSPRASGSAGAQTGRVAVFLSRKNISSAPDEMDAELLLEGPAAFELFGTDVTVSQVLANDSSPILLIGAPGHREPQGTTGAVYAFETKWKQGDKSEKQTIQASPVFTLSGDVELAETGSRIAVGRPDHEVLLVVASPVGDGAGLLGRVPQAGVVDILQLGRLSGRMTLSQARSSAGYARLEGSHAYGRLGGCLAFDDIDGDGADDMLVTQPLRDTLVSQETGAAFFWFGGDAFPKGEVKNIGHTAAWQSVGKRSLGRFGSTCAISRLNNDGYLMLGAPREIEDMQMRGTVNIYAVQNQSTSVIAYAKL